jgi:hypothetical protein
LQAFSVADVFLIFIYIYIFLVRTNPDKSSFKRKWDDAITRSADNPLDRGIERVAFSWKYARNLPLFNVQFLHPVFFISRFRYNNYHLFSFVPIQERLSGRALGTAYLGAAGMWIPVTLPSETENRFLRHCNLNSRPPQIPNPQALAHVIRSDIRMPT